MKKDWKERLSVAAIYNPISMKIAGSLQNFNPPEKKIASFHVGRCGSTIIGKMLNQHPDIHWSGQLYGKVSRYNQSIFKSKNNVQKLIHGDLFVRNKKVYGFETNYRKNKDLSPHLLDISLNDYVGLLVESGFTYYIHLKRKNLLRRFISSEIAKKVGYWHTPKQLDRPTQIKLPMKFNYLGKTISIAELFQFQEERAHELDQSLTGMNTLFLNYEDHIYDNPTNAYYKVIDFLALHTYQAEIPFKKTNDFNLSDILSNFDKVEKSLLNSPFEWMLEA